MADYCSLTLDCIKHVQDKVQGRRGASKTLLNRRQCEVVAQELLKVLDSLQARRAENLEQGIPRTMLLHLHATVKRVQILLESCCCENSSWLSAALTLGDIKEEVIAILLDLHQWTLVLNITVSAPAGDSDQTLISKVQQLWETGEEGYQRLLKQRSKMQNAVRDAARQDQEELLAKTANLVRGLEDQRGDDYIRGVYLKSRLGHVEEDLSSVEELKAYTISRDLGSGASGLVLQVKWLGQDVALKILKVIDKTEATILGRLQHPNIVRLFHYWEEFTSYPRSCIVMELMPTDLQKLIANTMGKRLEVPLKLKKGLTGIMPFSLPVAIDTMLQTAEAMRQLHEKKLTHRDLKTSNILVKPVSEGYLELHTEGYMEVKLADFGSSKAYANSSVSGNLTRNTGTTVYGAPEIFGREKIARERNFPPKADVWSFGMTCSEILTGKVPFADETPYSTLHNRIIGFGLRPKLPKDCPKYLQFCIESCWQLQPQRRPSFSDLCRMLRHAKILSLGLMDLENSKCLFAYLTYAGFVKTGMNSLHQQEESKVARLGFHMIWRNLRGVGGSAKPWQPLMSYSGDQFQAHSSTKPNVDRGKKTGGAVFHKIQQGLQSMLEPGHQDIFRKNFDGFQPISRAFTYKELARATKNFSASELLGDSGGFGKVYRGTLPSGALVAIKCLSKHPNSYAKESFIAEVTTLMSIRHRNLLQLLGWCHFKELMVVYDYMSNGSLDKWIYLHPDFGEYGVDTLSWDMRRHILAGVASGLNYLHEEVMGHCVLHRDIKSGNVLLDADFNAYLGDFELARLIDHHKLEKTTLLAGTLGYMAPEMHYRGRATKETDVYSFGILVLEVVCGRRPLAMHVGVDPDDVVLLDIVWRAHEGGNILQVADPKLSASGTGKPAQVDAAIVGGQEHVTDLSIAGATSEEKKAISNALHVGLLCCLPNPSERPSMRVVNQWLQASEVELPPLPTTYQPYSQYSVTRSSDGLLSSNMISFQTEATSTMT